MSNIAVTPGTGAIIAADDIGGGLLAQRVKLAIGATGTGVDLAFGQGTKANSISVALASDQLGPQAKAAAMAISYATDVLGTQLKASSLSVTFASDFLGQTTKSGSVSVTMASDQGALSVSQVSSSFDVANSFTRSANTTAYPANSVVGGALTFASVGPSAAAIMVTGAQLEIDVAAIPSGMTSFRLYLYNVTPPSALADNAAWDLPSGDRASFLGYIDLGTPADLGSTLYVEAANLNKQLRLSSANLFAYLVTNGGYTPGSGDPFKITLHTVSV